jgi:hypothetical protein
MIFASGRLIWPRIMSAIGPLISIEAVPAGDFIALNSNSRWLDSA